MNIKKPTLQELSNYASGTKVFNDKYQRREEAKLLTLFNGDTLSVQAGERLYSTPKADFADYYTHIEVGFPSNPPKTFYSYAENSENYKETTYPYIPIEVVHEYIISSGGVVEFS